MSLMDLVIRMFPFWCLGIAMIVATIKSGNQDLLKFDKKAFAKWAFFMVAVTLYRMAVFHFAKDMDFIKSQAHAVTTIPWYAAFTVFWEDMSFVVPLVLLGRLVANKWYSKIVNWSALAFMMAAFASGHVYQGLLPALIICIYICIYIPISKQRGQQIGFATMIACHMLYDFCTIMAIKIALGV